MHVVLLIAASLIAWSPTASAVVATSRAGALASRFPYVDIDNIEKCAAAANTAAQRAEGDPPQGLNAEQIPLPHASQAPGADAEEALYPDVGFNAYRKRGPHDVSVITRRVDHFRDVPARQEFSMSVFHPSTKEPASACWPVVVLLHPGQFLSSAPDTDFFDYGMHWASRGMVTVLSREFPGQFFAFDAGSVTDIEGQRMGKRGALMWYNLVRMNNTEPSSPLYGNLCNSFCAVGYSMGGSAAQDMGIEFSPEDGLRCIAPLHALGTSKTRTQQVKVPVMSGSSPQDTLTPVFDMWDRYVDTTVPLVYVVLHWGTHMISECGELCPVRLNCCEGDSNVRQHLGWLTAWLEMHLLGRKEVAPMIWNPDGVISGGPGIGLEPLVREVRVRPRFRVDGVAAEKPHDIVPGKGQRINAATITNSGRTRTFTVNVDSVSEECEGKLAFRMPPPMQVPYEESRTLPILITGDWSLGSNTVCVIKIRVYAEEDTTTAPPVELLVKTAGCVLSDWTEWSCNCPCDDDGSRIAPASRAALQSSIGIWARSTAGGAVLDRHLGPHSAMMRLLSVSAGGGAPARAATGFLDEAAAELVTMSSVAKLMLNAAEAASCEPLVSAVDADGDGEISLNEARDALRSLTVPGGAEISALSRSSAADGTESQMLEYGCSRSRGIISSAIPLRECLRVYELPSLTESLPCERSDCTGGGGVGRPRGSLFT